MRNRLLAFGRLVDNAKGILAAIHGLASVGGKLLSNFLLRSFLIKKTRLKLSIAPLADCKLIQPLFYHPEFTLYH
jgi:hypothetical protein